MKVCEQKFPIILTHLELSHSR